MVLRIHPYKRVRERKHYEELLAKGIVQEKGVAEFVGFWYEWVSYHWQPPDPNLSPEHAALTKNPVSMGHLGKKNDKENDGE